MRRIDWPGLLGRTFETIKGARFTVVRVTPRHVTIRPENGTRDYALSIPGELERVLYACATGELLPAPTELPCVGVRPVLTSYVWGILHAVMPEQMTEPESDPLPAKLIAGRWKLDELSEMGESYFDESDEEPYLEVTLRDDHLGGHYSFGLSNGYLDGALREFGGEQICLFGYEGSDEMDAVCGCGWLRLTSPDELAGEFVDTYGRFAAKRDQPKPEKRRRKH